MTREIERYDPMPSFVELPGWLWRRMKRWHKIVLAGVVLAAAVAAVVLVPQLSSTRAEREAGEVRDRARDRAERIRRLRIEQRPRTARSPHAVPAGAGDRRAIAARMALLADVRAAILADARRRFRAGRLSSEPKRSVCERFPRTVGGVPPERDLGSRRLRLACTAVTSEFRPGAATRTGGIVGHPYRVLADTRTGRFTYCKTTGVTEPGPDQPVTIPPACGGRPDR